MGSSRKSRRCAPLALALRPTDGRRKSWCAAASRRGCIDHCAYKVVGRTQVGLRIRCIGPHESRHSSATETMGGRLTSRLYVGMFNIVYTGGRPRRTRISRYIFSVFTIHTHAAHAALPCLLSELKTFVPSKTDCMPSEGSSRGGASGMGSCAVLDALL